MKTIKAKEYKFAVNGDEFTIITKIQKVEDENLFLESLRNEVTNDGYELTEVGSTLVRIIEEDYDEIEFGQLVPYDEFIGK